jgi:hypothetical protein
MADSTFINEDFLAPLDLTNISDWLWKGLEGTATHVYM